MSYRVKHRGGACVRRCPNVYIEQWDLHIDHQKTRKNIWIFSPRFSRYKFNQLMFFGRRVISCSLCFWVRDDSVYLLGRSSRSWSFWSRSLSQEYLCDRSRLLNERWALRLIRLRVRSFLSGSRKRNGPRFPWSHLSIHGLELFRRKARRRPHRPQGLSPHYYRPRVAPWPTCWGHDE